jgi:hypothetical protein
LTRKALVVAAAAALSAACAPIASFRPAAGFVADDSLEFGVGGVTISRRPYVIEEPRAIGQFWVSSEQSPSRNLTILGAFDDQALALGVSLRLRFLRTRPFVAAVDGELGYLFAGLSLPFSVRLVDELWLYAGPRLGNWGLDPLVGAPIGVSARIYEGLHLRGEWQRSYQDFKVYNRRDHFGLAAAYQF